MAIQLKSDPKIKINGEELEGYIFLGFKMTKRLLEPNMLEFTFRKKDMTLTQDDIKFELREKLLGALVECSVEAYRLQIGGGNTTDKIDNFFKGYIQHIKLVRASNKDPMVVKCTAFSPDSRLKQYPNCRSRLNEKLDKFVTDVVSGSGEGPRQFNAESGTYSEKMPMTTYIKPRFEDPMPYTVQYHESDYDFLKRMAKRYGEFFYYEDGTVVFGAMKEFDPITMRTGVDLEEYDYDLNMGHHTGVVFSEYDYIVDTHCMSGVQKTDAAAIYGDTEYLPGEDNNAMAMSAYKHATEYFNDDQNKVVDYRSARIVDEEFSKNVSANYNFDFVTELWGYMQRRIFEKYVVSDALILRGKARRADLKLGSVIVIEDETNLGWFEKTDIVQHEPLKVIDATYEWSNKKSRSLENEFKAIPQQAEVPPYLERDEHGFLTYGDFDIFPHSGPQHGTVCDNKDPLHLGRVRVVMTWQYTQEGGNNATIKNIEDIQDNITPWIRVSQPLGGYHRGSYIVPEIDDEVIVAFEHDNAECPYVAGMVHNYSTAEPDKKWTDEKPVLGNEYKAFRTRNGHTIEIRDKGKHGYIKIYDNDTHNYVVTYDTDRKLIRLESAGNIELDAKENIVLHAGKNVIINADNDMETTVGKESITKVGNNMTTEVGNDILRQAGNNIDDTEGSKYTNTAKEAFSAWIGDKDINIRMNDQQIVLSMQENTKNELRLSESTGVECNTEKDIRADGKQHVTIHSENGIGILSDWSIKMSAKAMAEVNGDSQTVVKGGVVKIN